MYRILKQVSLFILCTFLSLPTFAEAAANDEEITQEVVKQSITAFMKKYDIPGVAVELYIDGKPYAYYFGYADLETKSLIAKNTIFEVGSISKIITSLLLAQEIDYANIDINDSVSKYLKDLPKEYDQITLLHLATHTSGLAYSTKRSLQSEKELIDYLLKFKPHHNIGSEWRYSNLGMAILGEVLQTATSQEYNQLYRRHVLNLLGMQHLGISVPEKQMKYYAKGYSAEGNQVDPMKNDVLIAANAIKASASDMQRLLSAAIGLPGTPTRILYPMKLTQAAHVELGGKLQGLAWQIYPLSTYTISSLLSPKDELPHLEKVKAIHDKLPRFIANALIDKTGATNGFRTYIALIPSKKSGIVILSNKSIINNSIVKTGREILFKLTGLMPA